MNDKQKLALKELADVMEKHVIAFDGNDTIWLNVRGEEVALWCDKGPVASEYIREALKGE